MKLVCFIKEYHDIEDAVPFDAFVNSRSTVKIEFEKIVSYLRQGDQIVSLMTYILDLKTKQALIPHSHRTDGVWIWPSYFPYFLARYPLLNNNIDPEFISYLENKDYQFKLDAAYENRDKAKFEKMVIERIYGPQKW